MYQLFTDPYVILAGVITLFSICIAILPYFISMKYQEYLRMQVKVANYKILQDTLTSVSEDLENVLDLKDELQGQQQHTIGEWLKEYYLKQQQELIANLKGLELQTAEHDLPQTASLIEECLHMLNRQEFFAHALQTYLKPEALEGEGIIGALHVMYPAEHTNPAGIKLEITANEDWYRYLDTVEQKIFRICGLLIMNSIFRKKANHVTLYIEFSDEEAIVQFTDNDPSESALELTMLPDDGQSTILKWLKVHVDAMEGTIRPFIDYEKGMKTHITFPCSY